MKEKIVCCTKHKYTFKVAKAVSDKLQIALEDVETGTVEDVDLMIFIGGGELSRENVNGLPGYVKKLKENSVKTSIIVTMECAGRSNIYGGLSYRSERKSRQPLLEKLLREKKIAILGEHHCETRNLFLSIGHPGKKDIEKTISWIEKMRGLAGKSCS